MDSDTRSSLKFVLALIGAIWGVLPVAIFVLPKLAKFTGVPAGLLFLFSIGAACLIGLAVMCLQDSGKKVP
jgi:hypothetical protein